MLEWKSGGLALVATWVSSQEPTGMNRLEGSLERKQGPEKYPTKKLQSTEAPPLPKF